MLKSLSPQFAWSETEPSQFESSNPRPLRFGLSRSRLSRSRLSKPRLAVMAGRAVIVALCGLAAFLTLPVAASAQESFTLQAPALSENAIDPGGSSFATVTVGTLGGFNSAVDLTCQVTPTQPQTIVDPPVCTVSPASVTPPASASATITTMDGTTTVSYSVTVTGTAASNSQTATTPALYMTVIDVAPQFTITVEKPVVPASVPAGNSGVGTIAINPINGYFTPTGQAGITLSCSSITPLVTIPPICKFNPNPVTVNPDGQVAPSQLTVTSFGPVITTTGSVVAPQSFQAHLWAHFWALWLLPLPMLAVVGLGAAAGGKRSGKAWWLLGLFVMSGTLLLMPACGNVKTTTSTPEGVTPNNTYSFTISGVDANGVVSSNAGVGSTNPTVSLAVTTATTN
jgi:hypothetical protein